MMIRVERQAVRAAPYNGAGFLRPLLMAVVAVLTQRLPVGGVPHQRLIPAMRNDVIDHGGGRRSAMPAALDAQRIHLEVCQARLPPPTSIASAASGIAICNLWHRR